MSRIRMWVFVVGLGGLPLISGCGQSGAESTAKAGTKSAAAPAVVTITVAPLTHRPVERTVEVVGTLRGWEDVSIGSKREGRVRKVHHDMGDRVKPGELLVELDPVDADLSIRQAELQLEAELAKLGLRDLPKGDFDVSTVPAVVQTRVSLERAKQNLARERSLARKGAGTTQDLQNAENDQEGAEAALANAILNTRATLASARASRVAVDVARQTRLDTEIRAPQLSIRPPGVTDQISYAIVKRSVAEGQFVKVGDAVMELVLDNPLRLWANVPERYSPDVVLGQEARVAVAAHSGTSFRGAVARLNPLVDSVSRTFQAEVTIPNNRGLLHPGGFAKASIITDPNSKAAVVPIESVVRFAGVTKLFVVEAGKVRAISVETGHEGDGWIEVTGALPDEAQVVTSGQSQLADGTVIAIRTPELSPESSKATEPASAAAKPSDRY